MTIEDIRRILEAEVVAGEYLLGQKVATVCGSDLMSDVLAFARPKAVLLTGMTNSQVVRTAEMADLAGICFVRDKRPGQETVELAESKDIPLLTTPLSMFESCGRLWKEGFVGGSEYED
ncbi:MAG: hypothetical protein JW720_15425 [Sedimentisphaerales bacterium]|nr:hypothetical protein [Sedimentisphaerales bacterium]